MKLPLSSAWDAFYLSCVAAGFQTVSMLVCLWYRLDDAATTCALFSVAFVVMGLIFYAHGMDEDDAAKRREAGEEDRDDDDLDWW